MPGDRTVYRFGPYELDAAHRRLKRGRERLHVPSKQMDLLCFFAANPQRVISIDTIMEVVWRNQFVTPNSVAQVVKAARKTLGTQEDTRQYIETLPRHGYRFDIAVRTGKPKSALVAVDELLAPHRVFIEGRALLETLDLREIARARDVFEAGVAAAPDYADPYIGLANVLTLQFEATRDDEQPAFHLLDRANDCARTACGIEPYSAEALATFGFVLHRLGDVAGAIVAVRRALKMEPDLVVHLVRLGYVGWGAERVRAAQRTLQTCPGLAIALWLHVTVLIARAAFPEALMLLDEGCAAQDLQPRSAPFKAVGLHLQHALVFGAIGNVDRAFAELARELELADDNHVYGRECRANTWYTTGALRLRLGQFDAAIAAFHEALACIAGHRLATVGLTFAAAALHDVTPAADIKVGSFDDVMCTAAALALTGRHADASVLVRRALLKAPPGFACWQLPVDPLINVSSRPAEWAETLSVLRNRAL